MKIITADTGIDFSLIEDQHLLMWEDIVKNGLTYLVNGSTGRVKDFYVEIQKYQRNLLTGKPFELRVAKSAIERVKSNVSLKDYENAKCRDRLNRVFNYSTFINSDLPNWGAYKLVQQLDTLSCVYCNRIFTFTLDRVDSARTFNKTKNNSVRRKILKNIVSAKTRPELDHFYPKGKYPYLALAIYNLVPSCHICNSNLKGSRNVDYDNLINPYEDDFDEIIKIKAKLRNEEEIQAKINEGKLDGEVKDHFGYNLFTGKLSSFDLKFEETHLADTQNNLKAKNHINLYALEELYEMHKDQASRIIKNAIRHGAGSAKDIYFRHKGLFHSEEEAKSSIIGTECNIYKINRFPLSKLAIDITRDFGI